MKIIANINRTIENALSQTPFKLVPIVAADLSEPIIRPSIKVTFDDIKSNKVNPLLYTQNISCRIYYFAVDCNKTRIENLKMSSILQNALIAGFITDEVTTDIIDGVLVLTFDLELLEMFEQYSVPETVEEAQDTNVKQPIEQMSELKIKGEII
ncbi:MAG: hypothetical protein RSF81_08100 [Oscillospiraceae bacterium]